MYKILTTITGGVTGTRSAYVKDSEGQEMRFAHRAAAQAYAEELERAHREAGLGSHFRQSWRVEQEVL